MSLQQALPESGTNVFYQIVNQKKSQLKAFLTTFYSLNNVMDIMSDKEELYLTAGGPEKMEVCSGSRIA